MARRLSSWHAPAVIRAGLVLGVGVGYITMPHVAWFALLAVVLVAVGMADWWRKARPFTLQVDASAHHSHYCAGCDAQWQHAGEGGTCTRHWAAPCDDCARLRRTA